MSKLLRYWFPGNTVFVTSVIYERKPILIQNIDLIQISIAHTETRFHYNMIAWVIMPDHFHVLINSKNDNISEILQSMKMSFATRYRKKLQIKSARIWQRRFWDHIIRDESDLRKHLDYIHYNPVKHGISISPVDFEYSSFCKFVKTGYYSVDWGKKKILDSESDFGE